MSAPTATLATWVIMGAPGAGADGLAAQLRSHLTTEGWQVHDNPSLADLSRLALSHVLLMGLDGSTATQAMQDADAALRAALQVVHPSYTVIYGQGDGRLRSALRVLFPQDGPAPRWRGVCENCADPDCEFRLFTALKSSKAAGPAPA